MYEREKLMKKIFFYTVWDFTHSETDGICKKIISQINALKNLGYEVDYSFVQDGKTYVRRNEKTTVKIADYNPIWNKLFANKKLAEYIKRNKYDGIYCRYACADWYFIKFLKNARKEKSKIIVEIPSYPYDKEVKNTILGKTFLCIDKLHRKNMKKYIDKIATFSRDEEIFGIPTIEIVNGIDFSKIKMRQVCEMDNTINIIAVAAISKWHGYDRLIKGIGEYYKKGVDREIHFYVVGNGEELENYKKIVCEYGIEEKVSFCGVMYGEKLDELYNKCTLAVEVLGGHRKDMQISSSLKGREYAAKGLPMITSMIIDIFENTNYPYLCKVSGDEKPINVSRMIEFHDKIYEGKSAQTVALEIRSYAERLCDMKVTMKPITDFFE